MNLNATLLGQMISFAIFVGLTLKFIWPPILAAMQERQRRIAKGLEDADKAEHVLYLSKKEAVKLLQKAKAEAADIREKAIRDSDCHLRAAHLESKTEREHLLASAQKKIEADTAQVRRELAGETIDLALESARTLLGPKVDLALQRRSVDTVIQALMRSSSS